MKASIAMLNENVGNRVIDLRRCADRANALAAELRAAQRYADAEVLDQRAEALRCAALIAETRGLQS